MKKKYVKRDELITAINKFRDNHFNEYKYISSNPIVLNPKIRSLQAYLSIPWDCNYPIISSIVLRAADMEEYLNFINSVMHVLKGQYGIKLIEIPYRLHRVDKISQILHEETMILSDILKKMEETDNLYGILKDGPHSLMTLANSAKFIQSTVLEFNSQEDFNLSLVGENIPDDFYITRTDICRRRAEDYMDVLKTIYKEYELKYSPEDDLEDRAAHEVLSRIGNSISLHGFTMSVLDDIVDVDICSLKRLVEATKAIAEDGNEILEVYNALCEEVYEGKLN